MSTEIPIYAINVTDDALEDLDKIIKYIAETFADPVTAREQEHIIKSRIYRLNIFPNGCPIFRRDPRYRVAHVRHYKIIFEVDEARRVVSILRIAHSRRNI